MSLQISDLNDLFLENGLDQTTRAKLLKAAKQLELDKKEEKASDSTPKSKNKLVILVRGDAALAAKLAQGWVVSVKADLDESLIVDRLKLAATRSNAAQKKARWTVKSWADYFLKTKRRFSKDIEVEVQTKTKEPVRVIVLTDENAV